MENKIKAYKGFNKDMTCQGFKYEEGKEYEHGDNIKECIATVVDGSHIKADTWHKLVDGKFVEVDL